MLQSVASVIGCIFLCVCAAVPRNCGYKDIVLKKCSCPPSFVRICERLSSNCLEDGLTICHLHGSLHSFICPLPGSLEKHDFYNLFPGWMMNEMG